MACPFCRRRPVSCLQAPRSCCSHPHGPLGSPAPLPAVWITSSASLCKEMSTLRWSWSRSTTHSGGRVTSRQSVRGFPPLPCYCPLFLPVSLHLCILSVLGASVAPERPFKLPCSTPDFEPSLCCLHGWLKAALTLTCIPCTRYLLAQLWRISRGRRATSSVSPCS